MTSKREEILERIFELLSEEYITAKTIVRNRGLLTNDARPAIALTDGDERPRLTGDHLGMGRGGRVGMGPQLMTMTPSVHVIPESRKPKNEGIGAEVNFFKDTTIRIIANDPVLLAILGSNGSVAYMGMETDLKSGGAFDGQCRIDFSLTYVESPLT